MSNRTFSVVLKIVMAILPVGLYAVGAHAATYKVLYSFGVNRADGLYPSSNVIFDQAGDLYGTTVGGGSDGGGGTVFELTPAEDGRWTEKLLHSFGRDGVNGGYPSGGLIFDASGNLYGTTIEGGSVGGGTAFRLSRGSDGSWAEAVLHSFGEAKDGKHPDAGLVFDGAGSLYGTTATGGPNGAGIVFEIDASGEETLVHDFVPSANGFGPTGVVFDAEGNLYGTTFDSGVDGTVYQLMPNGDGLWKKTVLHSFNFTDGSGSYAGLIVDAAGNLYGTTYRGGAYGLGTVFELMPKEGGGWTEQILHSFHSKATGGELPEAALVLDGKGNLYGTTAYGGDYGVGELFELSPKGNGVWVQTVLHAFGHGEDGFLPYSSLVVDAAGNVYGTTPGGGTYGVGTVFEYIP